MMMVMNWMERKKLNSRIEESHQKCAQGPGEAV
jgi:hypothetical protein